MQVGVRRTHETEGRLYVSSFRVVPDHHQMFSGEIDDVLRFRRHAEPHAPNDLSTDYCPLSSISFGVQLVTRSQEEAPAS